MMKALRWFYQRIAAVLIIGMVSVAYASASPITDWLNLTEDTRKQWQISETDAFGAKIQYRSDSFTNLPSKRVLVLYARASPAYDIALNRLLSVFAEREMNVVFFASNTQNQLLQVAQMLAKAQALKIDLIYAMGSEVTDLLFHHYKNGKIPVVSVCAKDPVLLGYLKNYEQGSGTQFAFTSLNMQVDAQLNYLFELKPQLKNIGILVDARNASALQTQAYPLIAAAKKHRLHAFNLAITNPSQAALELANTIPQAIAAMKTTDPDLKNSIFWITGSTSIFKEIATINRYAGSVPVVSAVPEVATEGDDTAVVSIGISFDSNAALAAIYGIDILNGHVRSGDLKLGIVSPPDIAISFRKAREIGLKIPFSFFEKASFIYDYDGKAARNNAKPTKS